MGSHQSVAGELQGLHEKCVDALAEPKGAQDAPRLRALLGDVLTAIGRLQGGASEDACLLYTSPSPRDGLLSRMPSSA